MKELFDSILIDMVSLPFTIFYVLTSPNKVLTAEPNSLISTAGGTLFVSFIIYYLCFVIGTKIKLGANLPFEPEKSLVVGWFVIVIILLLVQYLAILICSVVPVQQVAPIKTIKALSYPVSVAWTVYGLVYLSYLLFPIGSKRISFQERLSPSSRETLKESGDTKRVIKLENAEFLAAVFGILAYILALYNIIRVLFGLDFIKTIFPTIVLIFSSLLLLFLLLFILSRIE